VLRGEKEGEINHEGHPKVALWPEETRRLKIKKMNLRFLLKLRALRGEK
jgi:hypothetical protein